MSVPSGYTIVNDLSQTQTVSDQTCSVATIFLTCETGTQYAVTAEVLSNAILYEVSGPTATVNHNSKRASAGDIIFVDPARNLRMRRDGTDACVHIQAYRD